LTTGAPKCAPIASRRTHTEIIVSTHRTVNAARLIGRADDLRGAIFPPVRPRPYPRDEIPR